MLRGETEVIALQLRRWKGDGFSRYYYNKWLRYLSDEIIQSYKDRFGIDPRDSENGIKMFFDDNGCLHIENCQDKELEIYLEKKMTGWYRWATKQYEMRHSGGYKIIDLIEPYTKILKPGYYQVRYNDLFFNFDESYRKHIKQIGYVDVDYNNGTYYVRTEHPDLDRILMAIMRDGEWAKDLKPRY